MRQKLTPEAIQAALIHLPQWHLEKEQIVQTMTFSTFREAIAFVNKAAALAEAANHHPDIDIRYNKLHFALTTHDAGGLTHNDLSLAAVLNKALTSD